MLARTDDSDADAGPRAAGVTERLCVVTRQMRPIDQLLRFVVAPGGTLMADLKRRLPGRGVWVTAEKAVVAEAVRRGAFKRSLKQDVTVPADLAAGVDAQLERAALDALGIVRKAGEVVTGFTKVEQAVGRGEAIAILHAAEAGADGARKIAAAHKRTGGQADTSGFARIFVFTSAQLDLALGRPNVVHAALTAGRASETFLARWRTLERYRADEPGDRDDGRELPDQQGPRLGSE